MAFDLLTHLKALCALPGLPGHETPVAHYLREVWAPLTGSQHLHPLGSLWAVRPGLGAEPRPRVLLAAHLDAIGLMVAQLENEFLRLTTLGSVDQRVMPGQLVMVHGRVDVPGIVALPPPHLLSKSLRDQAPPVTELLIDTGLPARRLRALVDVGDLVSFAQPPLAGLSWLWFCC
jgi:endoglucanase